MTRQADKDKVAFIVHPVDINIFRSYVGSLRPDKRYADQTVMKLFEWMPPYKVKDFHSLSLDGHRKIDAGLYMVPFLPEMQAISVKKIVEKVDNALAQAKTDGCTVAALGGFTSIVLQGLEEDYASKHGIRITSGNTFTAAIIIRSIEEITERFGVVLSSSALAIIGASGDIGSACLGYFCSRVKKIYLAARNIPGLHKTAEQYRTSASAEMIICRDNLEAVNNAKICIFVTSAYGSLFTENDFQSGTIVCDASAPLNVKIEHKIRDDVFIYHGGIAAVPFPIELDFDIGLASPNTFYGCQLEGLLIGLHPNLPCSWGRGNITIAKLNNYFELMNEYPTVCPVFTLNDKFYTEEEITNYADKWQQFQYELV